MPRYQHRVNKVIVSLPDGHRVTLGSEWEELGAKAKASPPARRRKAKIDDE